MSASLTPSLILIAAVARNGAIGKDNQLLWHLPEDMKFFRETTRGATVMMGRKTWESLPERFRPLPGRRNIVITRQPDFVAVGAEIASSLDQALQLAGAGRTFVIGGADIYAQAMPRADEVIVTEVDVAPEADAFFPPIDAADWQVCQREEGVSANGLGYAFVTYRRIAQ